MNKLSDKAREIIALCLFGLTLFALLATVSFVDSEPYNPSGPGNLCGKTGQLLAKYMLHRFGYAAYAFYLCIGLWGIILFVRKNIQNLITKAFGLLAFTLFFAALMSHFLDGFPTSMPDHGGLVGMYLNQVFTTHLGLGVVGTRIILVLLVMITFLLATDWLYYSSVVALVRWIAEKRKTWSVGSLFPRKKEIEEEEEEEYEYEEEEEQFIDDEEEEEEPPPEKSRKDKREKRKKAITTLLESVAAKNGREDTESPVESPQQTLPFGQAKKGGKPVEEKEDLMDGDPIQYAAPPTQKSVPYEKPGKDLLEHPEPVSQADLQKMISETSAQLEGTLRSFKIDAEVVEIQRGPVITMFEMELAPGIKVERIRALDDDIAMSVKAQRVRIVAPIPGKSTFGVEVPNAIREVVRIRELLSSRDFDDTNYALPICLGKDAAGRHLIDDLAKMPHLLVAGATGSGKSVCLNSIIMSLLYTRTPEQTKLILIDPKMVELSLFKHIPHLMCPVVTDMKRASAILEWAVKQMDDRYEQLSRAGVRNIYGYNKLDEAELRERFGDMIDEEKFEPVMPFVIIIVDELADLMMVGAKDVEALITRLAQKSRAVGIHLILATQRPSTNVITGLIKANMPTRIAFSVASKIDSRVILDMNGAEKLLSQGDMLYIPPRSSYVLRAQGAYVSEDEIRKVTRFLKNASRPVFEEELLGKKKDESFDPSSVDDLYNEAAAFIIETQRGSASLLQRRFSIGYTRASRLIDLMGDDGILGEHKGSQAREVLLSMEDWEERMRKKNKTNAPRT
ncbi:MAG: DNA translocase FtsK [Planctomycetota bacterium]|jgi:S-DNA-T family DNA segregation ATPase FtsK/SpoIIIE